MLVDLQGAQSLDHRGRGVARYVLQLALAMERVAPDRVDHYVLNPDLAPPGGIEPLVASGKLRFVDEAPYEDADLVHLTSPFELSVPLARLLPHRARHGPRLVVTLFDLIPEVLADRYLEDPGQRRRYRAREELVRQADRVVAISRHSAADAGRLLAISPDRLGVVTLAPSPEFRPAADRAAVAAWLTARMPDLRPPFVLYTGGTDARKNVERLVEAWGRLAGLVHGRWQLVLACAVKPLERNHFEVRADELGVRDDLVVTGWVPDDVLVALNQTADLAVYPALYEGYGLPVAEALACGTPAIASGVSSLPELLPDDALFDPADAGDIAAAIEHALVDDVRRAVLLRHAKAFPRRTWDDVARETVAEYDATFSASAGRPAHHAPAGRRPVRLALVTPLPPQATGVADFSARLVPELARIDGLEVDVYVDGPPHARDAILAAVAKGAHGAAATRPLAALRRVEGHRGSYDEVVYSLGNSEFHTGALAALLERPGTVLAHDVRLTNLYRFAPWQHPAAAPDGFHAALQAMYRDMVPPDLGANGLIDPDEAERWGVLMARAVIGASTRYLATSAFAAQFAHLDARPEDRAKIAVVPFAVGAVATTEDAIARVDDGRTVTTFGVLSTTKRLQLLLEAFAVVCRARPDARLVFAGRASTDDSTAVRTAAGRLGIADAVQVTGSLDEEGYRHRLRTTSVAVQLRLMPNGESSGAIGDCVTAGVPTLISDTGANRGIPTDAARHVGTEADRDVIATHLLALLDDASERERLSEGARRYAAVHSFAACAAALYDAVSSPA